MVLKRIFAWGMGRGLRMFRFDKRRKKNRLSEQMHPKACVFQFDE